MGKLTHSAFADKSFSDRPRDVCPASYKIGLKLNEDLAEAEEWSVAQIEARSAKKLDQVMTLFRLEGGVE